MKIAYIMSRFPLISETFILREMIEVEQQGHQVSLYPLMCEEHPVVHAEAQEWMARANCIPFFSFEILKENIRSFFQHPPRYLKIWWHVFAGSLSSFNFLIKGLYLVPKAVYTAKRIQQDGADHIHVHYASHPGLEAWIIHQLTGISYSITVHSHDIYDQRSLLAQKLKDAAFIAPISKYNIEFMANLVGDWVRAKCHVVHCGVDPARYLPQNDRPVRRPDDPFEVIQVGSLHWKKGQLYLIRAIALLRDQGINLRVRIIGEGEERASIESEIKNYDLQNIIELLGAKTQAEVVAMLPTADCYVQSSVSEGIPVALMEALACELPVVATNITGIPELVLDGKTGRLVPPADVEALAGALSSMRADPKAAKKMGEVGRHWVMEEFDLQKNVMKLVALFENMVPQLAN